MAYGTVQCADMVIMGVLFAKILSQRFNVFVASMAIQAFVHFHKCPLFWRVSVVTVDTTDAPLYMPISKKVFCVGSTTGKAKHEHADE